MWNCTLDRFQLHLCDLALLKVEFTWGVILWLSGKKNVGSASVCTYEELNPHTQLSGILTLLEWLEELNSPMRCQNMAPFVWDGGSNHQLVSIRHTQPFMKTHDKIPMVQSLCCSLGNFQINPSFSAALEDKGGKE